VKEVFPLNNFGDLSSGLQHKDYLYKNDDANFVKKPDPDKGWSELFFYGGYAEQPPAGKSIM